MKINTYFESIQGEGKYAGYPVLFIRLSGCNLNCEWCDTKYHKKFVEYDYRKIIEIINNSKKKIIVWTGGEPLLQYDELKNVIKKCKSKKHHIETNGELLTKDNIKNFDYISYSPKKVENIEDKIKLLKNKECDIKVVTDLKKVGGKLLDFATMLMPLTTEDNNWNKVIKQKVWKHCVHNNKKYCLRQHYEVWGNKREI